MQELWKTIKDVPAYAVSNLGRVKRILPGVNTYVGRIANLQTNRNGYQVAQLSWKGKAAGKNRKVWRTVHRLVLEAFIGQRPKGYTGHHLNGDKENNRLDNLEWVTVSENNTHALHTGLRNNPSGESSHGSKLKDGEVWLIKKFLSANAVSQRYIARMFRVHFATVNAIKMGHNWSHINYP